MIWGRILPNFLFKSSTFTKASLHCQSFPVSPFNSDNVGHQIRHVSAKPRFDFGRIRKPNDATAVFQEMLRMRPLPRLVDFTQLFGVLVDMKQYSLALQMLDEMLWRDASIKRSTFNIVMSLFHRMVRLQPLPSVVDYNKFWSGVIKIKQYSVALHLFHQMLRMDAPVDGYSLNIAINCFCCVKRPDFGFAVLGSFFKRGYEPDVVTFTTLLKGLMLVGKIQEAAKLLGTAVALVSTNGPWITFMKLRLDRVLQESFEADTLEEALASNPVNLEFDKPEKWTAPYPKYEFGWWEPFLPPKTSTV